MNIAVEHCNPFDGKTENIWMKCEHCGRYLFAAEYLKNVFKDDSCEKSYRILDIACADGYGCMLLKQSGFSIIGIDVNESYLECARLNTSAMLYKVDLNHETIPVNDLDAVVSFETIEHLNDPKRFLHKIFESLKDDGIMILSFPNDVYEKLDEEGNNLDPFHKHIFKKEDMASLLADIGFHIEEEYGQAICNQIVSIESDALKSGKIKENAVDELFNYDEKSIITLSRLIGYPTKENIEKSYSRIWICKKK